MRLGLFHWVTPNQLTLARILSIPLILWLITFNRPVTNEIAWGVFFFACLTDWWDGLLARARGEVSRLGKLLDPVADKMLVMSTLVMLVSMGRAEAIPTILIMMREFLITGLRAVAAADGKVIAAEQGAKYKAIMQMVATGTLILDHNPYSIPADVLGRWFLYISTFWTLWTGAKYFWQFLKAAPGR
ncbi:MAG: CDP-diacylglycerol--glycerol-3-phosphate 3-phosphatidyltransferase [Deltaproteobacteria bacterium]|nr:CDP-diacylglycerol--glycerol-3-phosphate 3-phosphatidyltransferase [Deltaproteobacteria bacterium]